MTYWEILYMDKKGRSGMAMDKEGNILDFKTKDAAMAYGKKQKDWSSFRLIPVKEITKKFPHKVVEQ